MRRAPLIRPLSTFSLKEKVCSIQRFFLLLLLGFAITACGFHLRGILSMPPWLSHVAIIIEAANRDLEPMLKDQLQAYHIQVSTDPTTARYWLIIEEDEEEQHITSVSSSTTPRQYQMTYRVKFKLQAAKGKEMMPSGTVTTTRQLTVNSDRILGSNDEENTLKREMRRDAVIQIMDRIGHYSP
ncbi:MAG: hypothetical protein CK424_02135 [Legionella sp.]|nr:MAG: hypothetical protein CK424_02135 [Legionella sp.]